MRASHVHKVKLSLFILTSSFSLPLISSNIHQHFSTFNTNNRNNFYHCAIMTGRDILNMMKVSRTRENHHGFFSANESSCDIELSWGFLICLQWMQLGCSFKNWYICCDLICFYVFSFLRSVYSRIVWWHTSACGDSSGVCLYQLLEWSFSCVCIQMYWCVGFSIGWHTIINFVFGLDQCSC